MCKRLFDRASGFRFFLLALSLLLCKVAFLSAQSGNTHPLIVEIILQDTIQSVSVESLDADLKRANERHPAAILLNLSSPGGTPEAADAMIQSIRQSPAPVIVYLREPQSQVSGQALRVLLAGSLSGAHPDSHLQAFSSRRVRGLSSAQGVAMLQSLQAELQRELGQHGHKSTAIDTLFTGRMPVSGLDASRIGLVDASATSEDKLLAALDGKKVARTNGTLVPLHLADARIETLYMTYREHMLRGLMNPDLAVLLLTLGALLVYLELNTPGSIIPGAAGVLLIMLSVYGFLRMPLRWEGVLLILLSAVLLATEAHFRQGALLACFSVVMLVAGLRLLVRGPIPELEVDWSTALGTGVGFGGITAGLVLLGAKARRSKVRIGADAMIGWLAVAQTALDPEGEVLVRGELWRARVSGDTFLEAGECAKVLTYKGLMLEVSPLPVSNVS